MVKRITMMAVMLALCFVMTLLGIPTVFGYIHLGDAFALLASYLLGPLWGAAVAALSGLFADLALGYALYAPATFVIRTAMALLIALSLRKANTYTFSRFLIVSIFAELVMILGYYGYHVVLYKNLLSPLATVPTDAVQALVSVILFQLLAKTCEKTHLKSYFYPTK